MFDLGEGLFDGIEVRRIGGQEPQPRVRLRDHVPDGFRFVASQIVHDDDVTRIQHGHELLAYIGTEALSIDWSIKNTGRGQFAVAQGSHEGQCTLMSMRGIAAQAFALGAPATDWRHIGLDPGLINKDEPLRIKSCLPGLPAPALTGDRGPCLLKSEQSFF